MADPAERLSRTIWIGVGLVIVLICLTFVTSRVNPRVKPATIVPLPRLGQVADFTLTNQFGQVVTLADLRGHVWVADIIFTRCPGPCARMTRQMKSLQDDLMSSGARLVSLTTDPDFDSPAVLKEYAARVDANPQRWMFLTGAKKEIAALALNGLKLAAVETKPEERISEADLFVHSTMFVVIDKQAQLRGVFETGGEGVEWTNVQPAMVSAIKRLEDEP